MAKQGNKTFVVLLIVLTLVSVFVSANFIKQDSVYFVGEEIRLDFSDYSNYVLRITTPYDVFLKEGSNDVFRFLLSERGNYTFNVKWDEGSEIREIQVFLDEDDMYDYSDYVDIDEVDVESVDVNDSVYLEVVAEIEEIAFVPEVRVGEPVYNKKKISGNNSQVKVEIPYVSENVTLNGEVVSVDANLYSMVVSVFAESKAIREVVIENTSDDVELEYYTPAPTKTEKKINDKKKEVVVSAPDYLGYENVFVSVDVSDISDLDGEMKVYWKEGNKYLNFYFNESEDEINFIVPHLSTQTFEIIVITNAEHLDSNREFLAEVYDEVSVIDDKGVNVLKGEYLRVVFEEMLDDSKDITIYAASKNGGVVEVYRRDSTERIASFGVISDYGEYKIYLKNLRELEDTFDLKVISGDVYFDHVIDPSWYNSEWISRKKITVPNSNIQSNLENFPMLIELYDSDLKDAVRTDANDVLFTGSDMLTKLSHEVELFDNEYNSTHAHLIAWVKVNLSASVDNEFYLYYNNSGAANQENSEAVWNSNFVMVQHLSETIGTHYDSSLYSNDGLASGLTAQGTGVGIVGGADIFANSASSYVQVPSSSSIDLTGSFTLEAWVNLTNIGTGYPRILCKQAVTDGTGAGYELIYNSASGLLRYCGGGACVNANTGTTLSVNQMKYVSVANNGTHITFYLDGVHSGTFARPSPTSTVTNFRIGNAVAGSRPLIGVVDEVRVSNVVRNSAWINATYLNLNSPLVFFYASEEENFDVILPSYSGVSHSGEIAGTSVNFSILITDNTFLEPSGAYIFSTNNSGIWVNDSSVNFVSTPEEVIIGKVLNSEVGSSIGYMWYFSDDWGNWASTDIFAINVIPDVPARNMTMSVVWPKTNVNVYENSFFNVTLNVTCTMGDCGTIDVYMDPVIESYESFESGEGGFTHAIGEAGKVDMWHRSSESSHDGSYSFKFGDTGTGNYADYSYGVLTTPVYTISDNSTFSFYHYISTEAGYDAAKMEYRVDGGAWEKVTNFLSGGYNDLYQYYSGGPGDWTNGENIWSGNVGSALSFSHVEVDLSSVVGNQVEFRFLFGSDSSNNGEGWYIDSVNFTTEVPGGVKGLIPVGSGDPFYTTTANPYRTNYLNEGDSQLVVFNINATGVLDTTYEFFGYANFSSSPNIEVITPSWNVTIKEDISPVVLGVNSPFGTINDLTPYLNFDILSGIPNTIWYNINGGQSEILCSGNCETDPSLDWYSSNWAKRKSIIVPASNVNSDLVDFPMLVELYDSDLKGSVRSDANDILFTQSDMITKLNHEIEFIDVNYNSTHVHLIAWVKVNLSATMDNEFYYYYNNSGAANQENSEAVWDSDFVMVQHLEESSGTGNFLLDSSQNANDGAPLGTTPQFNSNSIIDGGYTFTGNNQQRIEIPDDSSLQLSSALTASGWAYVNSWTTPDHNPVIWKGTQLGWGGNYLFRIAISSGAPTWGVTCGGTEGWFAGGSVSTGQWYHYVITFDGTTTRAYIDGVEVGTSTACSGQSLNVMAGSPVRSGFGYRETTSEETHFDGSVDELRISSVPRSAEWIRVSYENQVSPSDFFSVGVQEIKDYSGSGKVLFVDSEGDFRVNVFANNTNGDVSSNYSDFSIALNNNFYDSFDDDHSILNLGDAVFESGSVRYFASEGIVFSESFESYPVAFTGVENGGNAGCSWYRDTDGTPSGSTGPSSASDGSFYSYVETSDGQGCYDAGSVASMESTEFEISGEGTMLSFWYHMYGADTGTLNVDVYDGAWENVWSISGQQQTSNGANYIEETIDLSAYSGTIQVRFRYVAAGGFYGDTAVDNVRVVELISKTEVISRTMSLTDIVAEFTNVSWNYGSSGSGEVELELSVDDGNTWRSAVNNLGLVGFSAGYDLKYKIIFEGNNEEISLYDLNLSWTNTASPPPNVLIHSPSSGTLADVTPVLNFTISDGIANSAWYTINGGSRMEVCSSCTGNMVETLYLQEGNYLIMVYADNSIGTQNTDSVSLSIDMNGNYFDSYLDDSQLWTISGPVWMDGNVTYVDSISGVVLNETFENLDDWTLMAGNWDLYLGSLRQSSNVADTYAINNLLSLESGRSYNISMIAYDDDNDDTGIIFRYRDTSNYYRCRYNLQTGSSALEKISSGTVTTLATISSNYVENAWNSYTVKIDGNISCYLNNELVATAFDNSWENGKMGIYNSYHQNVRYDDFIVTSWKNDVAYFTSYLIKTLQNIVEVVNVSWNYFSENPENEITVDISVDDGNNWHTATNGMGLGILEVDRNLMYRVNYNVNDSSVLSLLDINIDWTHSATPAPTITIDPVDSSIADTTPVLTASINGPANTLWYTINDGSKNIVCTSCSMGSYEPVLLLEEGSYVVRFYANNSIGTESTSSVSFAVNMNRNYFDDFFDDSQIANSSGYILGDGNITVDILGTNSSPVLTWDAHEQSGDPTWANSGRSTYSYRTIVEAGSVISDGSYVRVNFVAATDTSFAPINPSICERLGSTSDCVPGTWTRLYFDGADTYVIPVSGDAWTDWSKMEVDSTKDYMISYYGNALNDGFYYLTTGTTYTTYSLANADYSNYEDWSSLSPINDQLIYNIRYMESIETLPGGSVELLSHPINVTQTIRGISEISWSDYGTDVNNVLDIDLSVDGGETWFSTINGNGVSGFTSGDSLVYRLNFSSVDNRVMSLLDLNITWEEPPAINIHYPMNNYVYNYPITKMNYTIDVSGGESLVGCWYTTDGGLNNHTVICGEDISVTSVDGVNVWTIYAEDTSGFVGRGTVQFIIDTSAPTIVFLNQSANPVDSGSEFFVNVNVTDSNLDRVWIVIWENVVGGAVKFTGFFNNLFGNLFSGSTGIDDTYDLIHNYTIYANDTTGLFSNYTGSFDVLMAWFLLDNNPIYGDGVMPAFITGHLGLSNGLDLPNHPFNIWFEGNLLPLDNLTAHGTYLSDLNFTGREELFSGSLFTNVSDVGGYLTLTGSNTTGSMEGVVDAGALVDWGTVDWDLLSGSCSGTINYYDGVSWGYSGTRDTYIDSGTPTTNYGVSEELNLDTSPSTQRVLLKFADIFGYGLNKIPYDSSISAATLSTYVYTTGNAPTLYEVLEDWGENSATYNGRLSGTSWSSVGVSGSPSRSNTPLGTISATTVGVKSLNVVDLVTSWNNGSSKNYGVVYNPGGASGVQMRSSEYGVISERPRLDVSFSSDSCAGIEVYYRTSKDKVVWSDWNQVLIGDEIEDAYSMSRYLEYKVVFGSHDGVIKPNLWDIEFNYSATVTDSDGRFNYSFYTPSEFGTYDMNLTSGYRTISAKEMLELRVQSGIDPVLTLVSPENNYWSSDSDVLFLYNATDLNGDLDSAVLIVDGVVVATNNSLNNGANEMSYSFAEGSYNWSIVVNDSIGLTDSSLNRTLYVDLTDPIVSLNYPPHEEGYTLGYLNLSFTPLDNMDDNLTCNVTLNSVNIYENVNFGNGSSVNVSSGALVDGTHYWNVTCEDNSGRSTSSETREFIITDTPPSVSLVSPANGSVVGSSDVEFIFFPDDNSGILVCELLIDDVVFGNITDPILAKDTSIFATNVSDGFHNWSVRCEDLSSSVSVSESWIVGVDTEGPVIEIFNLPNNFVSDDATPDFEIRITDGIDDELSCDLLVSGWVWESFNATSGLRFNHTLNNSLLDGIQSWQLNCSDDSGYYTVSELRNIDIREVPSIQIVTENNTHISSSDFEVSFIPSDNDAVDQCSLYINGVLNSTLLSINQNSQNFFEPTGFVNGIYDYYISCLDLSGNLGYSETYSMTLDTVAPSLYPFFPLNEPVYAQNITFNFTATDVYSEDINCSIIVDTVALDSGIELLNGTNVSRVISGISDGTHDWQLECVDLAGNSNTSEVYNFTKFTAPGINLLFPDNATWLNYSDVSFVYFPMDDEGIDRAELFLNGVLEETDNSVVANVNNSFDLNLADGVYDWYIRVTDTSLMPSDSETRRLYVDTSPPTLILNVPTQGSVYDRNGVNFSFTVSDNLDPIISCDLYLDGSLEWSGNASSGVEQVARILIVDGNHTYNINCSDDARNSVVSSDVDFEVFAPPIIKLISPVNMTKTTNSSINFSYVPEDDLGLIECSMYFDSVNIETSFSVVPNVVNNFTVNSILEGVHNWSVECVDTDMNVAMSNYSILIRDVTAPVIQLISPENSSSVDSNLGSASFRWNVSDNLDTYLECDLYVDSVLRRPNILMANGSSRNEVVSGLDVGYHDWNVECNDFTGNIGYSDLWNFNYSVPDFEVLNFTSNISVGVEGESVLLNATIVNTEMVDSSDVLVEIYLGHPSTGELVSSANFNLTANEEIYFVVETNLSIGLNDFWVVVDRLNGFNEVDENNNLMSRNISVGAWHFFYGDVNPESEYVLGSDVGTVVVWNITDYTGGTIFVSSKDSSIEWSALRPLGRDVFDVESLDDFSDADDLLGMPGFSDSIEELYLDGGTVERQAVFNVFGRSVTNVPITTSISSLNFYTGILWDSSDDTNDEYDVVDSEDLVFATEINPGVPGSYGTYDYEIRVPAGLRDYSGSNSQAVFYLEL